MGQAPKENPPRGPDGLLLALGPPLTPLAVCSRRLVARRPWSPPGASADDCLTVPPATYYVDLRVRLRASSSASDNHRKVLPVIKLFPWIPPPLYLFHEFFHIPAVVAVAIRLCV
jgi:hypothetical protein